MSVKLRTANEKRQRRRKKRALALPFIATIAMAAPGCTTSGSKKAETETSNPPPPRTTKTVTPDDKKPATKPTTVKKPVKKPVVAVHSAPPKGTKGHITVNAKGDCKFHYADDCDPGDTCNPPAPHRVLCLPDQPKSPKGIAYAGRVVKQKDGCYFRWATPDPEPQGKWNPPPPKKVKCW